VARAHGRRGPFNTSGVLRRLDAALDEGAYPQLTAAQLGLLRALIGLADWQTGEIPAGLDKIATLTRLARGTVSRERVRLMEMGLLRECWRSQRMVQYALSDALRAITIHPQ
jgi:hypothetical protein